jgi:hypothetical protein
VNTTSEDDNSANDATCKNFAGLDPYAIPCNITLALEFDEERPYYNAGNAVKFRNDLSRLDNDSWLPPYIVEYTVTQLFTGSPRVRTTENENLKQFTPECEDEVCAYEIANELEMIACNNSNAAVNDSRIVVVKGAAPSAPDPESSLSIGDLNIPKDGYMFGDLMNVDVMIVKGNTSKYSVKLWVESDDGRKVSAVTSFSAKEKYVAYEATLPVALKADSKYKTGQYRVVMEGLDEKESENLWIKQLVVKKNNATSSENFISSFSTRSKKANENINLYATISAMNKNSYSWNIVSLNGNYRGSLSSNGSTKVKAEVSMVQGPNPFVLQVLDGNKVLDEKSLFLEMNETDITKVDVFGMKTTMMNANASVCACNATKEKKTKTKKILTNATTNTTRNSTNVLSGLVAYEQEDGTQYLPAILGALGATLAFILVQRRR